MDAPRAQYLLYTPPGVTVCKQAGACSVFSEHGFCSYHGQVTWIGIGTSLSECPFNQLIDGHLYYLQDIWSNTAGCVPRIGPTPSFTAPARGYTGQPTAFDASGSL